MTIREFLVYLLKQKTTSPVDSIAIVAREQLTRLIDLLTFPQLTIIDHSTDVGSLDLSSIQAATSMD